jgi:hypothetical protein
MSREAAAGMQKLRDTAIFEYGVFSYWKIASPSARQPAGASKIAVSLRSIAEMSPFW